MCAPVTGLMYFSYSCLMVSCMSAEIESRLKFMVQAGKKVRLLQIKILSEFTRILTKGLNDELTPTQA